MGTTVKGLRAPTASDPYQPHVDIERLRDDIVSQLIPDERTWKFERTSGSASDSFPAGSFASLIGDTITDAPAGRYLIQVDMALSAASADAGNLRVLVNSVGITEDIRDDLSTSVRVVNYSSTYTHATLGNLAIAAQFQTNAAVGTIWTSGSAINVSYLGPV